MKKKILFVLFSVLLLGNLFAQETTPFDLLVQYQNRSTKSIPVDIANVKTPEDGPLESPIKELCKELYTHVGTLAVVVVDKEQHYLFPYLNDPTLGKDDPYYNDFVNTEYSYNGELHDMLPVYITPRLRNLLRRGKVNRIMKICGITYVWDEQTCEMFTYINYEKLVKILNESAKWFHKDHPNWMYENKC